MKITDKLNDLYGLYQQIEELNAATEEEKMKLLTDRQKADWD